MGIEFFFFFSSRRRHTRSYGDWSSDVCSSDLPPTPPHIPARPSAGGRVPVTARLSKRFYDVFGEEIATELVDWFNAVDATYRADLRELNELNFARFDAKLEQRLAQVKSDLVKWMFVFWAPTALGVVSLLLLRR